MITKRKRREPIKVTKADKSLTFTYKDVNVLAKYMTEQGYIIARSKTGLSQKQQRELSRSIKQARHLALLPFTQTV
jgi:small subunit ribosomal protein S18